MFRLVISTISRPAPPSDIKAFVKSFDTVTCCVKANDNELASKVPKGVIVLQEDVVAFVFVSNNSNKITIV